MYQLYQRILVPLDGSQRAEAIMPHVTELARRYDATVILMRVVVPVVQPTLTYGGLPTYTLSGNEMAASAEAAHTYLADWQARLSHKGIEVKTIVTSGPVVAMILQAAERENADLIAMSSHGRTGLPRVFYGSVAAGVLHQTEHPLLLIRSHDIAQPA
jgi:nucleotide-binding universal stress UspA family protein